MIFYEVLGPSSATSTIMPPSPTNMDMDIKVIMNMNSTLGAAFIGNNFGAMQVSMLSIYSVSDLIIALLFRLFGITTLQAFTYFRGSPQDRWPFKLLVRKKLAFHLKIMLIKFL